MKSPSLFDQPAAPLYGAEPVTVAVPSSARLNTPEVITRLRLHVWQEAPKHEKGIIRGQNCLQIGGSWPQVDSLTGEQLLSLLPHRLRAEYLR